MSQDRHQSLADLLFEVERQLRELSLWSETEPSAEQLASVAPFCIDTLNFPQWLQFVMLPQMKFMLEAQLPLPSNSQIAPMAEEYFRGVTLDVGRLCALLHHLDRLLGIGRDYPDSDAR